MHSNLYTIDLTVVHVKYTDRKAEKKEEKKKLPLDRLMSMREKHARKRVIKKN